MFQIAQDFSGTEWLGLDDHHHIDQGLNPPTDLEIFQSLGFQRVESLDTSDYEGATIVADLNHPLPNTLPKFDLIFDGGTTEHIFNQPTVLRNIHSLLNPGGVAIHYTPANNHVDHGYFQFSPSFHYEYYLANGYEIVNAYLVGSRPSFRAKRRIYVYSPLRFEHRAFGGWGSQMLATWITVHKASAAGSGFFPQQGRYVELFWSEKPPSSGNSAVRCSQGRMQSIKDSLRRYPRLYRGSRKTFLAVRRLRLSMQRFVPERPYARI